MKTRLSCIALNTWIDFNQTCFVSIFWDHNWGIFSFIFSITENFGLAIITICIKFYSSVASLTSKAKRIMSATMPVRELQVKIDDTWFLNIRFNDFVQFFVFVFVFWNVKIKWPKHVRTVEKYKIILFTNNWPIQSWSLSAVIKSSTLHQGTTEHV